MRILLLLLIIAILYVIQAKCRESLSNGRLPSARLPVTLADGDEGSRSQSRVALSASSLLFINYWNGTLAETSGNPDTKFKPLQP